MVRAICDAVPENVRGGGCVESVLTVRTQRRVARFAAMELVAVNLKDHSPQHVSAIQSPMRQLRFAQRIARSDRHASPAIGEMTIQLLERSWICHRVVRANAEVGTLLGLRFDAVRVDD